MNLAQRERHLKMWAVLLPVAVMLIVLGWFGRSGIPVEDELGTDGAIVRPVGGAQP
jgi:hypothetical protein